MIDAIRKRLQDEATTLTSVEVITSVEALAEMTQRNSGAGFVAPFRERAKPNQRASGGHLQEVTTQVAVAFLLRSHAVDTGADRVSMFDQHKGDIEAALAGWQPADATDVFELVGGESTALAKGVSIYVQTWETSRILTGDEA